MPSPAARCAPKIHTRRSANVAWTRTGIPATTATCQDQRIECARSVPDLGGGRGLELDRDRGRERHPELLAGREDDLVPLRPDRDARAEHRADGGALGDVAFASAEDSAHDS